jgi:hypothetical protein
MNFREQPPGTPEEPTRIETHPARPFLCSQTPLADERHPRKQGLKPSLRWPEQPLKDVPMSVIQETKD